MLTKRDGRTKGPTPGLRLPCAACRGSGRIRRAGIRGGAEHDEGYRACGGRGVAGLVARVGGQR